MPKSKKMPPLPFAAEQAIAFAFDGNPGSLSGKLRAIFEAAMALIFRSEQEHEVAIKKAWGRDSAVLESRSLDLRVGRRKTFNNATKGGVLTAYEATLDCLGEITDAFKTRNALKHSVPEILGLEQELHGFWSARSAVSVQELDKLVPLFFSLQLHCWHLYAYLERPGPTFEARQARAQAGGLANNDGEEILRARMLEYLVKLPPDVEWKSLAKFLEEHSQHLEIVLRKYQTFPPLTLNGRPASACMDLKIENINRKMGEWGKGRSDFLHALQRLIPTYRRQ